MKSKDPNTLLRNAADVPQVKLRLPVMKRACKNCKLDKNQHLDGKCLFEASNYEPGTVSVSRKVVKCFVEKK